ncbi:MAG: four-helix bundle copper-binding protein [Gemmatimonadaceae bacterium]
MTAQYCLAQGGAYAEVGTVGLLLDCAEICQTSANFMVRGSPYHTVTCAACAELCRACAEACRAFEQDENMAHCAEVCELCAESCEQMATADERATGDE